VKIKNTHCMTLRIPSELDLLITDAAFDARQSKSTWIRVALQRCLRQQQQRHDAVLR
jgi:predicted transcriptional regulator